MVSSKLSNQRTDIYGGNMAGRFTFVKEVIEAIKQFAGDHFLISYRMGWTEDLETDVKTAQLLAQMGVDMLHVSTGIPEDRVMQLPLSFSYNDVVHTASYIKKQVTIPVIAVNDIHTIARGNHLIKHNDYDFVAYGRPFLADPHFVDFFFSNPNYKPCIGCKKCQWFTDGAKCPARIKRRKGVS